MAEAVMASLITTVRWLMLLRDQMHPSAWRRERVSFSEVVWVCRSVNALMVLDGSLLVEVTSVGRKLLWVYAISSSLSGSFSLV
jgi:hypothetical protein